MDTKELARIGEVPTADGRLLPIYHGWNTALASNLVRQSRQPEILKWTPRDAAERFSSVSAAEKWYGNIDKMPIVYSLGLSAVQLAGFAWFSIQRSDKAPGANLTMGIRVYEGFNGQGLARPFAEAAHQHMDYQYVAGVWLETDSNNLAAQRLYANLGYVAIEQSSENRILMARKPADLL